MLYHQVSPYLRVLKRVVDEAEANARLIAAAPDMLEALHDVLRYCVTPSGLPDKNKGRTPEQDAAMAKAKAAIAKAEGNQ